MFERLLGKGWPLASTGGKIAVAGLAAFTYDDVARLLGTLDFYLPTYRERLGDEPYALVRGNLQVLTDCFYSEPLVPEALEVIYEHLLTLTRMLAFRVN